MKALNRTTCVLALALGAAACGENGYGTGTGNDGVDATADVAAAVGSRVAAELGMLLGIEALATGLQATGSPRAAQDVGTCTYSVAAGKWTCTASGNGYTGQVTVAFVNVDGQPRPVYDPFATDIIPVTWNLQGAVTRPGLAGTATSQVNVNLAGLGGVETSRRWSGAGAGTLALTYTDAGGTRAYTMANQVTVTDLTVALPRSANPWPTAGTLAYQSTGSYTAGGRTHSFSRSVSIAFNGTSTATLTVGGETFQLDLTTGAVRR